MDEFPGIYIGVSRPRSLHTRTLCFLWYSRLEIRVFYFNENTFAWL